MLEKMCSVCQKPGTLNENEYVNLSSAYAPGICDRCVKFSEMVRCAIHYLKCNYNPEYLKSIQKEFNDALFS